MCFPDAGPDTRDSWINSLICVNIKRERQYIDITFDIDNLERQHNVSVIVTPSLLEFYCLDSIGLITKKYYR